MIDVKSWAASQLKELDTIVEQATDAVLDAQWDKAEDLMRGGKKIIDDLIVGIYRAHHVSGCVGSTKREELKDGRRNCEEND